MLRRLIFLVAIALLPGCEQADENSSANQLVVEVVKLLSQAKSEQKLERQLELATEAEQKLHKLIERYPGSDAAVKLVTTGRVGALSLEHVAREKARYALEISGRAVREAAREAAKKAAKEAAKEAAREAAEAERKAREAAKEAERMAREGEVCFAAPNRKCLWGQALATARGIRSDYYRAWALAKIAGLLTAAGDVEQASQIFDEARATASEAGYSIPDLETLAEMVGAEAGDVKGALATAKEIGHAYDRAVAFARIASNWPE